MNYIDIVFDGPPSHESGRFVEVEDANGKSIRAGEWIERSDGYWALRITQIPAKAPRFANVSCSQCGQDFGPGDHGFSHCEHHKQVEAVATEEQVRPSADATPPLAALHDREAVIEECARVCERQYLKSEADFILCGDTLDFIAARIRSLSPRTQTERKEDDK